MDGRLQPRAWWRDLGSPVTVRDIEEETKKECRVTAFSMQRRGVERFEGPVQRSIGHNDVLMLPDRMLIVSQMRQP